MHLRRLYQNPWKQKVHSQLMKALHCPLFLLTPGYIGHRLGCFPPQAVCGSALLKTVHSSLTLGGGEEHDQEKAM